MNVVLRKIGLDAETLDINNNLNPHYVGDISNEKYIPPKVYDCVLCAEVLEHIPFDRFGSCLKNLYRTTNRYAVITLPNCLSKKYEFGIMINHHYREVGLGKKKNKIAPMHFWELNSDAYCTYKEVAKYLNRFFSIKEEGMIIQNRYHYYYILEKNILRQ